MADGLESDPGRPIVRVPEVSVLLLLLLAACSTQDLGCHGVPMPTPCTAQGQVCCSGGTCKYRSEEHTFECFADVEGDCTVAYDALACTLCSQLPECGSS